MKKFGIYVLLITLALIPIGGCSKKNLPALSAKQNYQRYDSTAFDYIFTEALKQKFLGNAGDALKYLQQCVEINPQSDAAWYEMAQISLMLSDKENGKKFALKAATLNERNLWYLMLIANVYYEQEAIDSAILFYEKAALFFPEKENIRLNLARIYSEKREFKKADEIYKYFESKYRVSENISLSRIKNLMNSGDWQEAEKIAKALISEMPDVILYNGLLAEIYREAGEKEKAMAVYETLMKKDPGNPQTLLSLSDFFLTEKEYTGLFGILNQVILSDSISSEDKVSLMARMIDDTNLVSERSKELEMSLLVFEATGNKEDVVLLLRPELYKKQNNFPLAIERLETIIKTRPDNYFAWEGLLILYAETKEWDKLFVKGKECATKFNTSLIVKVLYANAAIEKGQFDVAEEELRKGLILAGNNPDFQLQVLVMKADMFYKKGDFNRAWEVFKEALKIKPEDPMVMNNYAYYLAEQGQDLKEAEKMAKYVIDKEKGNSTYLDTYAWVLFKKGKNREAQKILEAVISSHEKPNSEWFEHMGYIYKSQGKCEKAIENWKLSLELDKRKVKLINEIENCIKR
jgi:predicted Zn-dependent protease